MNAKTITNTKKSPNRKEANPPAVVYEGMNLLDYLSQCRPSLDKKIIDIACAEKEVPESLKEEVSQEIQAVWAMQAPDTKKYKPSQIAAYAHRIAGQAALRIKRELGSAVRLPGSAFRLRKDGSSYLNPGILAQALDWNELESWMDVGDGELGFEEMLGCSMEFDNPMMKMEEKGSVTSESEEEEAAKHVRLEYLSGISSLITEQQFNIIKSLIDGAKLEEIMAELGIKKGVLMREISIAGTFLGPEFRENLDISF